MPGGAAEFAGELRLAYEPIARPVVAAPRPGARARRVVVGAAAACVLGCLLSLGTDGADRDAPDSPTIEAEIGDILDGGSETLQMESGR